MRSRTFVTALALALGASAMALSRADDQPVAFKFPVGTTKVIAFDRTSRLMRGGIEVSSSREQESWLETTLKVQNGVVTIGVVRSNVTLDVTIGGKAYRHRPGAPSPEALKAYATLNEPIVEDFEFDLDPGCTCLRVKIKKFLGPAVPDVVALERAFKDNVTQVRHDVFQKHSGEWIVDFKTPIDCGWIVGKTRYRVEGVDNHGTQISMRLENATIELAPNAGQSVRLKTARLDGEAVFDNTIGYFWRRYEHKDFVVEHKMPDGTFVDEERDYVVLRRFIREEPAAGTSPPAAPRGGGR